MANRKVRWGLSNTKYAIYDAETGEYGELKPLPWAVSLSLSTEGGDGTDFWADNKICYTFPGSNGGYSGDLELSNIPDAVRADLLGEVVDDATGAQFEVASSTPPQFALVTEMKTDMGPIAFAFYNCKASRPGLNANTENDNPDVDTETLPLRIATQEFEFAGASQGFIQGHIQKTSDNADQYAAFLSNLCVPGKDPSVDAKTYTEDELNALTIEQIRNIATNRGYTITESTKAEIINEFLEQQNA